jgi:hypothetical protein
VKSTDNAYDVEICSLKGLVTLKIISVKKEPDGDYMSVIRKAVKAYEASEMHRQQQVQKYYQDKQQLKEWDGDVYDDRNGEK